MTVPRQAEETRPEPPGPLRRGALEVLTTLRAANHEAYFAGGCVRDEVLGVEPKDWDIATSAKPEAVMALFPRCVPVGISFGVVRVLHAGFEYEVATFRADGDYDDHRRPSTVRWASAREDVYRRDFTINGLLGDPFAPEDERVVDFVGGVEDLKRRLIRAIGDPSARFTEDYLRMIRAVRFAARFGFAIHPDTMAAIVAMSSRVVDVSAERIGQELDRLLSEGGQPVGLKLLAQTGLLPHLLPELSDGALNGPMMPGPAALAPDELPSWLTRAADRLSGVGRCEVALGWALLLWERLELVEGVARRLRMSRARAQAIAEIISAGHTLTDFAALTAHVRKRTLRLPTAQLAIAAAHHAGAVEQARAAHEALASWSAADLTPPPLINGKDLAARGHRPGPAFASALTAVEDAQLDGAITEREAALALAERVLSARSGAAP